MAKKSSTKPVKSGPKATSNTGSESQAAPKAETTASPGGAKKVSQALLDTFEKRKQAKAATKGSGPMFGRPAGRRGRRPKRPVEYTPQNSEEGGEESFELESDYQHIEYDTGIRVDKGGDDGSMGLEGYDFDEELNFDR